MSLRERLAGALHDASIPDADGYSLPQRMMSAHGGPRDSSYLDAADMILGTRYFDSGWLADSATGPLDVERLVDIIEQAIFETGTGLEAALLASERIAAEYDRLVTPAMEDHAMDPTRTATGPLDVERLADFIRDKIESEPYQGLHPELSSMGLAIAIRDEFMARLASQSSGAPDD